MLLYVGEPHKKLPHYIDNLTVQFKQSSRVLFERGHMLHWTHWIKAEHHSTHRHGELGTVPYDSGQVYLVFGWVWSMREEGISHGTASTRKTLRTRLKNTKNCNGKMDFMLLSLTGLEGGVSSPSSECEFCNNCGFTSMKTKNVCLNVCKVCLSNFPICMSQRLITGFPGKLVQWRTN